MDLRKALSAALLVIITFFPLVLNVPQDIPDDVVYTDGTKTLIRNNTGLLTCRFKETPLAVYWKKGSDPRNAPLVASLHYGEMGGPRYDDGSCDINENYSLVIKRARIEDAGRYICRVASYKGNLIHNFTDVKITDAAVETRSVVALQKGLPGVLPCEPIIRPKKVSWLKSPNELLVTLKLSGNMPEVYGPGYDAGLFNITKEYSLVIKDVMIMHEDRYICEVIDYDTDKLFWNTTELKVFAFPMEPFPSIEECPKEQRNLSACTLRITSRTTLTCHVEEYYPHIDLFFVHGSERVDSLESRVWNNSDGTKNKRITISSVGTIDTIYECVAAGMVGQADSRSMAIHLIRDDQQFHVSGAVAVPIIFVSTTIVIAVLVFRRRKAHLKHLISYIEIWMLLNYAVQRKKSNNLANVLDYLLGDEVSCGTSKMDKDYYTLLCKWKKGYTGKCQRGDFFHACRNQGLKAALDQLEKYSDSTREVTSDDLKHTLWHVGGGDRIIELLKELGALPEQLDRLHNKSKKDIIVGAINILKYWRDVNNTGNQEVMLSLALEKINFSPNDKDFFRIPQGQKRGLNKNEIQAFLLPAVTSRHCTVLVDAIMKLKEKYPVEMKFRGPRSKDVWIDDVIEENRTSLFDSYQMMEDWWVEKNCSNYDKRCKLQMAADFLEGQASGEKWTTTKKFEQIAKLVPEPQMTQLCGALNIRDESESDIYISDEAKGFKALCRWSDTVAEKEQEEKNKELSTALKTIGFEGLLSRPKGKFIYKAELVDMALGFIMEDFRLLADTLGIKGTRFISYKQAFRATHLQLGTIGLMFQLFKVMESISLDGSLRTSLCSVLDKAGYQNTIRRLMFASEPSHGELFAIAHDVTQVDEHNKDVVIHMTTEKMEPANRDVEEKPDSNNDDDYNAYGNKRACGKSLHDLQGMLQFADENIPESMKSTFTMLKVWKETVCPVLIDHRVVLAEGLQKTRIAHLVPAVVNGQYHSNKTSIEFIEDMLKGMDEDRRTTLRRLMKIKSKRLRSPDRMPQVICDWIADWTKEMEPSFQHQLRDALLIKEKADQHRKFNDGLVEKGFLDLAREIMIIEQYW